MFKQIVNTNDDWTPALALMAGVMSRVAAAGIAAIMVVAALKVHLSYGFFMNWFGNQAGEGIEFHTLALALALTVALKGSGALSVDRRLAGATVKA